MRALHYALFLLAASGAVLGGQRITVFSEFQRPGPGGGVVSADQAPARREILSPALVRNGYASFLFTVEAPPGELYTIYIAQNPGDTVTADLYQLEYAGAPGEWIPDGMKPARQPVQAVLSEGQKTQAYLLDLFLPGSAPVERSRLEIQVHAAGHWTIYPMEMRPMETVAPPQPPLRGTLAPVGARADTTAAQALRAALCGTGGGSEVRLDTLRAVILRNTLQDLALARRLAGGEETALLGTLARAGGWTDRETFCRAAQSAPRGPEWWLRIRGFLYQGRLWEE